MEKVMMYRAEDGREFYHEKECLIHEQRERLIKINIEKLREFTETLCKAEEYRDGDKRCDAALFTEEFMSDLADWLSESGINLGDE